MGSLEVELRVLIADVVRQVVHDEIAAALAEHSRSATVEPGASDDRYLSVREAGKLIGMAPDTIRRWVHDGQVRAYWAGSHLRLRLSDLHAHMARQQVKEQTPEDTEERVRRFLADVDAADATRCADCGHLQKIHSGGSGKCHGRLCSCPRWRPKAGGR